MTTTTLPTWMAAVALTACLPLASLAAQPASIVPGASAPAAASVPVAPPSAPAARAALPDFADLVEKVGPAVVNIRTTATVPADPRGVFPQGLDDGDMSEFFRRFFGIPLPQGAGRAQERAARTMRPTRNRTAASARASSCPRTAT